MQDVIHNRRTTFTCNLIAEPPRREVRNGRSYLVRPVTSIVTGVLNGSKGALRYDDRQTSRNVDQWDGMPILVNHPQGEQGQHVSGDDPAVWAAQGIGFLRASQFHANVAQGHRVPRSKLKHEAWFDEELTQQVDRRFGTDLYGDVLNGRPIEGSTGLYTDNKRAGPNAVAPEDGRRYDYEALNYRPDHYAVLPHGVGACSVRDGCGINVNQRTQNSNPEGHNQYTMISGTTVPFLKTTNGPHARAIADALQSHGIPHSHTSITTKEKVGGERNEDYGKHLVTTHYIDAHPSVVSKMREAKAAVTKGQPPGTGMLAKVEAAYINSIKTHGPVTNGHVAMTEHMDNGKTFVGNEGTYMPDLDERRTIWQRLGEAFGVTENAAKKTCALCRGTGKIRAGNIDCPDCGGSGDAPTENESMITNSNPEGHNQYSGTAGFRGKSPSTMSASEINKHLDRVTKERSDLSTKMIDSGRGDEKPSDYQHKSDSLSMALKDNVDAHGTLRNEVEARTGSRHGQLDPKNRLHRPTKNESVVANSNPEGINQYSKADALNEYTKLKGNSGKMSMEDVFQRTAELSKLPKSHLAHIAKNVGRRTEGTHKDLVNRLLTPIEHAKLNQQESDSILSGYSDAQKTTANAGGQPRHESGRWLPNGSGMGRGPVHQAAVSGVTSVAQAVLDDPNAKYVDDDDWTTGDTVTDESGGFTEGEHEVGDEDDDGVPYVDIDRPLKTTLKAIAINSWTDAARQASVESRKVSAKSSGSASRMGKQAGDTVETLSKGGMTPRLHQGAAQLHDMASKAHREDAEFHTETGTPKALAEAQKHLDAADSHDRAASAHREAAKSVTGNETDMEVTGNDWSDAAREAALAARTASKKALEATKKTGNSSEALHHAETASHHAAANGASRYSRQSAAEAHDKAAVSHEVAVGAAKSPADKTANYGAAKLHKAAAAAHRAIVTNEGCSCGGACGGCTAHLPATLIDPVTNKSFTNAKRSKMAAEGTALPDGSFPIESVPDLKNAVKAVGRAKDPAKARAHIKARAKALGETDMLPDTFNCGGDMNATQLGDQTVHSPTTKDASLQAAKKSLEAGGKGRKHAIKAVDAEGGDSVAHHEAAASAHEADAATEFAKGKNGDETAADQHLQAAAAHRKAAAMQSATTNEGDDTENDEGMIDNWCNQHGGDTCVGASSKAKGASHKARKSGTASDHLAAATSHRDAAEEHQAEGDDATAKEHLAIAKSHDAVAKSVSKGSSMKSAARITKSPTKNEDKETAMVMTREQMIEGLTANAADPYSEAAALGALADWQLAAVYNAAADDDEDEDDEDEDEDDDETDNTIGSGGASVAKVRIKKLSTGVKKTHLPKLKKVHTGTVAVATPASSMPHGGSVAPAAIPKGGNIHNALSGPPGDREQWSQRDYVAKRQSLFNQLFGHVQDRKVQQKLVANHAAMTNDELEVMARAVRPNRQQQVANRAREAPMQLQQSDHTVQQPDRTGQASPVAVANTNAGPKTVDRGDVLDFTTNRYKIDEAHKAYRQSRQAR